MELCQIQNGTGVSGEITPPLKLGNAILELRPSNRKRDLFRDVSDPSWTLEL